MGRVGTDEIGCHDRRTGAGGPCNVCDGKDKDAISLHNESYRQFFDLQFSEFRGSFCDEKSRRLSEEIARVFLHRLAAWRGMGSDARGRIWYQ